MVVQAVKTVTAVKQGGQTVSAIYLGVDPIWSAGPSLPAGYKKAACIFPTAKGAATKSAFSIPIRLDQESEVAIDFSVVSYSGEYNTYLFGNRESATSNNFSALVSVGGQNVQFDFGSYSVNRHYYALPLGTRVRVEINKTGYFVDGDLVQAMTPIQFRTDPIIGLFNAFRSGSLLAASTANVKIYGFSVAQAGAKVLDLIPCYREADRAAVFYDTVGQSLITTHEPGMASNFTFE